MSRDPLGDVEGLYQYGQNNPVNRIDPHGTWSSLTNWLGYVGSGIKDGLKNAAIVTKQTYQSVSVQVKSTPKSTQISVSTKTVTSVRATPLEGVGKTVGGLLSLPGQIQDIKRFVFGGGTKQEAAATAGTAIGAFAGARAGLVLGAAIGSVVPGVGTVIGGVAGGIIGGVAGGIAGYYIGNAAGSKLPDANDPWKGLIHTDPAGGPSYSSRPTNNAPSTQNKTYNDQSSSGTGGGSQYNNSESPSNPNQNAGDLYYRQQSAPGPVQTFGSSPNRPIPVSPGDWYVQRDGGQVTLCALPQSANVIALNFYVEGANLWDSGWVATGTDGICVQTQGLGWYTFGWRVRALDSNYNISDWSDPLRHFSIDSQQITLHDFQFVPSSPSASDEVNVYTCADGFGGIGNGLYIYANTATDGSASGDWYWIDPKGTFCYDPDPANAANAWPQWHTRALADGTHLIRAIGFHGSKDQGNYQEVVKETTFTLLRRRPSNVQIVSPQQDQWFNSRTVNFQWQPEETGRVQYFLFDVSTNSDPTVNPIIHQQFNDAAMRSYSVTFAQDYSSLYWGIQACNEIGCGDRATGHFGIDRTAPNATVTALPTTTYEVNFPVRWSGTDNASGIVAYDVQYRDGLNGSWLYWKTNTTATVGTFTGEDLHTYYFRARARDRSNNEGPFAEPYGDTSTRVDINARPVDAWWNSAYASKRNLLIQNNDGAGLSTGHPVLLRFDASTNPTAASLYNASRASSKGDDFRIVYNNQTELSRYIPVFTPQQIDIWFDLQAPIGGLDSAVSLYQLYYDNAAAVNPPASIDDVMPPGKDANTVGLWHFNEGAGTTVNDSSGNNQHATIQTTSGG
ncbi:MAG: hypothetical protein HY741_02170, partial [Chloroflexi bacterium]|nr:hypothetical protein [Chloroflexota bacterium]